MSAHGRASLLTPPPSRSPPTSASKSPPLAVQVHGGAGFIEETAAAPYYRDARITLHL